jgi:hypothetical protein
LSGKNGLGILVPSCDNYSDAWGPFFQLLFRYWPDPGYPVYLVSNLEEFRHPRVINIRVGPDTDWSSNLLSALDRIPESHLLIILEDYFLVEPVDGGAIRELFLHQCRSAIGYLRLYPCPGPREITENVVGYGIGFVDKEVPYRASLQSAIWKKELLRNLARRGESAWDFEDAGSRRSNGMEDVFVSVAGDLEGKLPLKYLCTAIVGKHWTKEAVALCARHSIPIDFGKRKLEPWYRRLKRNPYYQIGWRQIRKVKEIVRPLRVPQV